MRLLFHGGPVHGQAYWWDSMPPYFKVAVGKELQVRAEGLEVDIDELVEVVVYERRICIGNETAIYTVARSKG